MMEYFPNNMEHNDCLNHVFQLSINDEILEKPEIKNIVANVRAFTNYTSVLLSSALRKRQEELGWEDKDIQILCKMSRPGGIQPMICLKDLLSLKNLSRRYYMMKFGRIRSSVVQLVSSYPVMIGKLSRTLSRSWDPSRRQL